MIYNYIIRSVKYKIELKNVIYILHTFILRWSMNTKADDKFKLLWVIF